LQNWNSIGDHIPAYLINLILALGEDERENQFKKMCESILEECTELIVEKFVYKGFEQAVSSDTLLLCCTSAQYVAVSAALQSALLHMLTALMQQCAGRRQHYDDTAHAITAR
jgi:hypothetical protein